MRYVKIKAKTYNDAMMKLKMEHGDDAIPISHKYVKEGGLLNSKLFARDVVELTAAIQEKKAMPRVTEKRSGFDVRVGDPESDRKILTSRILSSLRQEDEAPAPVKSSPVPEMARRESADDDIGAATPPRAEKPEKPVDGARAASTPAPERVSISRGEFDSLKRFEKEFVDIKETLDRLVQAQKPGRESAAAPSPEEDRLLEPCRTILKNNDYDTDECCSIMQELKNSISRDDLRDKYKIEKSLRDLLKSKIVTSGPYNLGHKKKVIMFFGPTGVGKTTTMAKLGAIYALREDHTVSFVTLDNYRIAATEQLKKYAEIMKIPVHAVNDRKEFKQLIDREKSEIILIDTSGRSHRNELKISEIKSFADLVEYDFEKILCVSANTKKADVMDIFKSFDKISFDSIIITKVDETSHIGNVIDIAERYKKPISYYTVGQEVPNDIVLADPDKLVNLMFSTVIN